MSFIKLISSTSLLLLIIWMCGCRKEKSLTTPLGTSSSPHDVILYHDVDPDTSVYCYTSLGGPFGCTPIGSTQICDFDVNNDGINDFRIFAGNSYSFVSASNPCANYTFSAGIRPLRTTDSIITGMGGQLIPTPVNSQIDSTAFFDNSGILHLSMSGVYLGTNGDNYAGFKLWTGSGYSYGWIQVESQLAPKKFALKSFAINSTENSPILTGQTE